jgi:autotransporter-associated beta strand protein
VDDIQVHSGGQRAPMARIETHLEPGRKHFTLHLQHEITGAAEVRLNGSLIFPTDSRRPTDFQKQKSKASEKSAGLPESVGDQKSFDAPRPAARRIQQRLTLAHDGSHELKPLPDPAQQRVDSGATSSTFAFNGTSGLRFEAKAAAEFGAVEASYVFQLGEQKAEILAALTGKRKRGTWLRFRAGLPEGYEVQSVQGPVVAAWQHDGRGLYVHFTPQAGAEARFVVHLTRAVPQAVTQWKVEPLELPGFEKHTSKVLLVAHAATELRLPALADGLQELDATALDSVFAIAPPMEKKRAFQVDGAAAWSTQATLARQPARFAAETVALVLASDAGIRVSQQLGITVEQGALRNVSLTLPASLPEAVVSGPLLREMRSRIENGLRVYECSFQSDVLDATTLTFDLDLPLGAELNVPFATVPGAGRVTRWFVVDNASAREAKILTQRALEPSTREQVPYLPAGMARPQFFRATGDGELKLGYTQLAATEGNAALVTLADIATHLRGDGQRWEVVTYSLINRSLQFLPVLLPEKAVLIAVSVGGEPVRADEETRNGRRVRLIPLIHTRPGQRAIEVQLIYRFEAPQSQKLPDSLKLDDPELDGLSAERTTWTVWVPKSHQAARFDGNMDETAQEGLELQKLEGMLSELGEANRVLSRADVDGDEAKAAYDQAKALQSEIAQKKEATLSQIVSNGLSSVLSSTSRYSRSREKDEMDLEIEQQGRALEQNYKQKESQTRKGGKEADDDNTSWTLNKSGAGTLQLRGSNTFSGDINVNGGLVLNDNLGVNNTYFGGTTVNAGQLAITAGGILAGNSGNTVNLAANAAPPTITTGSGAITLSGSVGSGTTTVGAVSNGNVVSDGREFATFASPGGVNLNFSNGTSQVGQQTLSSNARGNNFNNAQVAVVQAPKPAAEPVPVQLKKAEQRAEEPVTEQQAFFSNRASGKHSLALLLPTGGEAHHFTKLKDHAVVEVELKKAAKSGTESRWIALGAALLIWFFLARLTRSRKA